MPQSETGNNEKLGPDSGTLARVIIFAESGLLAGDLAAWLSSRFLVERATSVPGALRAFRRTACALIIVEGEGLDGDSPLTELVWKALDVGCRILVLGADPRACPAEWTNRVIHLKALPHPGELFVALNGLSGKGREAEG